MEDQMFQPYRPLARLPKLLALGSTCLALVLAVALPLAQAQAPAPAAAAPAKSAIFKNLKVLPQNISKDELKKVMKSWSKALGGDCELCHKEPNMDEDTPKKITAREMMQMTAEINGKFKAVQKKLTCFTCHRGQKEPTNQPGAAPGK
jgi:cytochrome c553